jgi:hypothetical protein
VERLLSKSKRLDNVEDHMTTPAQRVIEAFGGVRKTARLLELNPATVCRWTKPRPPDGRGSGGLIPSDHHRSILDAAKREGVAITAEDLIASD